MIDFSQEALIKKEDDPGGWIAILAIAEKGFKFVS